VNIHGYDMDNWKTTDYVSYILHNGEIMLIDVSYHPKTITK